MQPAKNGDGVGARDDALHLSRRSLSLADFSFRSLRSASSFPLGTGHTQMGPSILRSHCYSKYPAPCPSFAQCDVTMPSHSWALLPVLLLLSLLLPVAAEWRMEKQTAGGASCYVECRIRGKLHSPPSPPGPPIVAFIPPLHFPPLFPKSFDLLDRPRKPIGDIKSLLSDEYINNVYRTRIVEITRNIIKMLVICVNTIAESGFNYEGII